MARRLRRRYTNFKIDAQYVQVGESSLLNYTKLVRLFDLLPVTVQITDDGHANCPNIEGVGQVSNG